MGISPACHQLHIEKWLPRFSNYKKKWPKNLFRHEPIDNAIAILKAGRLSSRNDAMNSGELINDIAPTNIIQNREEAHDWARLYFRPRTPTQYHVEGIRKEKDYYDNKHAGFLVMMALNSETILTMPSTRFSDGNMQATQSRILDGDDNFRNLDFSGIYHDEAYPTEDEKRKRCAEVLAKSPLILADTLKAILVRTDADIATLKYRLQKEGLDNLIPLVKKSESIGVFFGRHTALEYVDSSPGRINFKLKYTASGDTIKTEIIVHNDRTKKHKVLFSGELNAHKKYYTCHDIKPGQYRIIFKLEGCYAHESVINFTK